MAVILDGNVLTLTGYVGESTLEIDGWTLFDGFTYPEVVRALSDVDPDSDLIVHINSPGGYATEGSAIRSALAGRSGRTDVVIDGIAASAASVIAMAGERITMTLGSILMIHDPSGMTWGTAADHERAIRSLNALGDTYAAVYSDRCGKGVDECRAMMRDEVWLTPEEAIAQGFADAAEMTDDDPRVAAFPYQIYSNAPERLVALAKQNGWRSRPPGIAAIAAQPAARPAATSHKEIPMADKTPAGDQAPNIEAERAAAAKAAVEADRARRAAIMSLEEAAGREALAEHLYTTEMSVDDIRATLAKAPKASATEADPDAYERARIAGAGLGGPAHQKPTAAAWGGVADKINARR